MLDVAEMVKAAPASSHLYCCGPLPMLEAFEAATGDLARDRVHVEYFIATEPPATEGGFTVILAKSNREIEIPSGKTILAALSDSGVAVSHSCTEGVCGTCETRVLEGTPDHRDRHSYREHAASVKQDHDDLLLGVRRAASSYSDL